jgi:homoserine O-acetyltransferase
MKNAAMAQQDYEVYKLGDWELQSGEKLIDAHIAYKTFGNPESPAIVYPTWFSGRKCGVSAGLT